MALPSNPIAHLNGHYTLTSATLTSRRPTYACNLHGRKSAMTVECKLLLLSMFKSSLEYFESVCIWNIYRIKETGIFNNRTQFFSIYLRFNRACDGSQRGFWLIDLFECHLFGHGQAGGNFIIALYNCKVHYPILHIFRTPRQQHCIFGSGSPQPHYNELCE